MSWPDSAERLRAAQESLRTRQGPAWRPPSDPYSRGGCFVCFPRQLPGPGGPGDPAWAGAALLAPSLEPITAIVAGRAGAPYEPGLLALREGPLLEAALRALPHLPEILLVNATGLDHPRGAGLALHLGAVLGVATVGVTHRPLLAEGAWPERVRGAQSPLRIADREVGRWLCTRTGARPLAIHAGWRTAPQTAVEAVLAASSEASRTPEPIRLARRAARTARSAAGPRTRVGF